MNESGERERPSFGERKRLVGLLIDVALRFAAPGAAFVQLDRREASGRKRNNADANAALDEPQALGEMPASAAVFAFINELQPRRVRQKTKIVERRLGLGSKNLHRGDVSLAVVAADCVQKMAVGDEAQTRTRGDERRTLAPLVTARIVNLQKKYERIIDATARRSPRRSSASFDCT